MPQSLSATYVHIVFSTKNRLPFLSDPELRNRVHAYLGGIARNLECHARDIGGISDHVHLLLQLSRTVTQADLVRDLKSNSHKFVEKAGGILTKFEWQKGYSCFSVSASMLERVEAYINTQDQHHRIVSYQDEVRALLKAHGVEWDERYVWD